MTKSRYLRTNEHEEAVRSLEWAEQQARTVRDDPYQWKWVLISLHNAAQGFMILSLWNGNGLLALRDEVAKKWLSAHENEKPYPADKLDNFLNLYGKVKNIENFQTVGAGAFVPGETHDNSLARINAFRNEFIHFTPKGWSLELAGLPDICLDVLDLIQILGWKSTSTLWHKKAHPIRARRAASLLRRMLILLRAQYGA